jgi:CobQ-like glutamine amidotransferase family enzyme
MIDIMPGGSQAALGHTIYGYGNNGGGTEGAVSGGIIATNAQGPVLVKNPWLALRLINKAMRRKGPDMTSKALVFEPSLFGLELASAKAIKAFNEKKEKPK